MSHHLPNPHNLQKNMRNLKSESGVDGAVAGAGVATASVGGIAALIGLSITPVGWIALAVGGAVVGASGLIKKLDDS